MRKAIIALTIALALETAVTAVLVARDHQRIQILSEELYAVPDPLRAQWNPRVHENRIEELEQRVAELEDCDDDDNLTDALYARNGMQK